MAVDTPLRRVQRTLDTWCSKCEASSCTFYVRDKLWRGEFRLAAMSNIKYPEPMHGFLSPVSSRARVVEGAPEVYLVHEATDGNTPLGESLDGISAECRRLFGDFVQREGVKVSARLQHRDGHGDVNAVLFVNYADEVKFNDRRKARLRSCLKELGAQVEAVQNALSSSDVLWLSEAARIVSPDLSVGNIILTDFSLTDYFELILEATLNAFQLEGAIGTIHIHNAEEQRLTLIGSYGPIAYPDNAVNHSVKSGQGVVSWVVRRHRALLISDLKESTYQKIHVCLNDSIRSELAVPIEAAGELVGVMCLESPVPGAFSPHHVRSAWYAANRVAIFYQLRRQAVMTAALLDFAEATESGAEGRAALKRLATLARDYLKASFSDISCFNLDDGSSMLWASTYDDSETRARPDGWTQYCRRIKKPLWITWEKDCREFRVHHWHEGEWIDGSPSGEPVPQTLNPALAGLDVRGELALPITVGRDCVGVAWIKYKSHRFDPPQAGLMTPALGFAAHAALIVQSIHEQETHSKERSLIDRVARTIADEMRSRWEAQTSDLIDFHPLSIAYRSRQGGDVYARKRINADAIGVLLIDGEGHGVQGLLQAMPLLSTFESVWNSCSAAHVISQLRASASALGVRANAMYCIVMKTNNRRWLLVAPAGNVFVIHFRRDGFGNWHHSHRPNDTEGGAMLGGNLPEPQLDEPFEIHSGDVIVMFTDGVADHYEIDMVVNAIRDRLIEEKSDPRELAEVVINQMRARRASGFTDDATVIVGRVR
jgi:GAF domain-containing protein